MFSARKRCGCGRGLRVFWQEYDNGAKRHLRVECSTCGRFIGWAPQSEFWTAMAEEQEVRNA